MTTKRTSDPLELGRRQLRDGRYIDAETSLTKALGGDALRSEAYCLRAMARTALGNVTGAESDFAQAMETSPLDEAAEFIRVERGIARFNRGKGDIARLDFERALQLNPKDGRAQDYLRRLSS
jgi:Tfp pilus assembly protein PilF